MKKCTKIKNSANELYDMYTISDELIKCNQYTLSVGVYDVATFEECFWLLDLIIECEILCETTQKWELHRLHSTIFNIICYSSTGEILYQTDQTDIVFYFDFFQLYKKGEIFCLPTEKDIYF